MRNRRLLVCVITNLRYASSNTNIPLVLDILYHMQEAVKNLTSLAAGISTHPAMAFIPALLAKFPHAEIFLVCGAVRDAALGLQTHKDYDFVVRNVLPTEL